MKNRKKKKLQNKNGMLLILLVKYLNGSECQYMKIERGIDLYE